MKKKENLIMKKAMMILIVILVCVATCSCEMIENLRKSEAVINFEETVNQIGEVTIDSKAAISTAEEAYNALTAEEKEQAKDSYAKLIQLKEQYDAAVRQAELEEKLAAVVSVINDIGDVTLDSEEKIIVAEEAFAKLSDEEKAMISDAAKILSDSRSAYEEAVIEQEKEHANEVVSAIDDLGTITIDSKSKIESARELYDDLTANEKKYVSNYDKLNDAENEFNELWKEEQYDVYSRLYEKFNIESDPIEGITWYTHKSMPKYIDTRSYLIPYIGVRGNNVWICIRFNYTAGDWLFWKNLTIMSDGQKYYRYNKYFSITRDNDGGRIWEYYDEPLASNADVTTQELKMLQKIASSTSTIVRFSGDDYYDDLTIGSTDKQTIQDVLDFYVALMATN